MKTGSSIAPCSPELACIGSKDEAWPAMFMRFAFYCFSHSPGSTGQINSHNTADDFSSLIEKKQETETESARHSRFTCPTDYSAGSTNPEDHDTKVYRPACLNWPTRDK